MTVSDTLKNYADLLEKSLSAYLPPAPEPENKVREAMAYSLLGGGKRIRGALTLAFYELFHDDIRPALSYAAAVEMVHAYSLIHDDLPCMDNSDTRRGKPSCHVEFGEWTALLAGDGLLNLAFEVMSNPDYADGFCKKDVLRAIRCLSLSSGYSGMIGGQAIDLWQEQNEKEATEEVTLRLISKKTGALIRASGEIGCVLGGADEKAIEAAISYCEKIGLAFQIRDDILNIIGDSKLQGKPVGSDAKCGKNTWVSLYGIKAGEEKIAGLNLQAKDALSAFSGDTEFLAGLADLLADREF